MADKNTQPENKKPGRGKQPPKKQPPSLIKQIALTTGLVIVFNAVAFQFLGDDKPKPKDLVYSDLIAQTQKGEIKEVTIHSNNTVTGKLPDGTSFKTQVPGFDPGMMDLLRKASVKVTVEPPPANYGFLGSIFTTVLFMGFMYWLLVGRMGGGGAFGLGKSKAKLLTQGDNKVSFDDVAGVDEAKADLKEIVDFLKEPAKFSELGAIIPKGALLVGPPGTGKTLLARAVAGEAGVPFFSISGSDFVEMFVGVGAGRVRSMFEEAKKNAPCIIFIDEIDAVGRHRGGGMGGGNDEREQTLNQLLVEMDGFDPTSGIIIVAATNRPDVLDAALLRRFVRQVTVPLPDVGGREKILMVHMQKIKIGPDVRASVIARGTPGFSGADLANLVNEAALMAGRRESKLVAMADFEAAKDKILMGAVRSLAMSEDEKKLTAYHEAGHALILLTLSGLDPLHKVTIIPRGRALGVTVSLPERDRVSLSKSQIEAQLVWMFGGRIAEEMIFGAENVTTGASGDIQMATDLARRAVTEWGMSEKLGRVRNAVNPQETFAGYAGGKGSMSEETAKIVDEEVRRMIAEAETKARKILTDRMADLHALAKGLLDYETLDKGEVEKVIKGIPLMPPAGSGLVPPVLPQPPQPPAA